MPRTVVILGGSIGGLHVAHAILKKHDETIKVILVTKNTHFYWNLASVRAIVPGQIKDEDIFKPLESALSRYPASSWELVIGTATAANFDASTVEVTLSSDGSERVITYDQLVLATGSRCAVPSVPWKAAGSYEEALSTLHDTAAKVKAAESIVVAGAGSTGIEVAGELGYEFGKTKSITLLCAGDSLLGGHPAGPSAAAELAKLNVAIKYRALVQSTRANATDAGKTDVVLSDGGSSGGGDATTAPAAAETVITTDLYLPTTGLFPNTSYIPPIHLSTNPSSFGTVLVDEYLRVKDTANVWACGDVVGQPRAGFFITQKQAAAVGRNVLAALAGADPAVAKGPPVDILACAVGRARGVGRVNGKIKLPSLVVWAVKGRTLALGMVEGYVDGSVA
ncbi:hypothetical protein C8A05DRAFT_30622 [Staphylotrichum tortipilum]|uniref:FAD/NAD(P)-binding domain-containing protein n=1 Tax=Staphylotrichum tortipilum TaxID=2831512 RepID=A0AAN6RXA6_9PEZI|nr:hypothetical protein C8A05DRAFT_30622 [Staphylotrichum longicolle]